MGFFLLANDCMKKRLFFDMDNVLVDFQSGLNKIDEEVKKEYRAKGPGDKDRLDEIPGLFGKMEPMSGAIEAVHKLAEVYDVFILSTAPWKNPSAWSDKVTWVTKYFDDVFHKRMIITHRKDLVEGDYLIDDRGKNGTSEFKGEWIQLGSERFPDWDAVLEYLLLEEFLEKSDRKGLEALLLCCVKELHGDNTWVYDKYLQMIDKVSVDKLKTIIEVQTSNYLMPPSVVINFIDEFAGLYCKKECDIM